MKNEIAEYLVDSFIDYKGLEHKIVLCALSVTPEHTEDESFIAGLINQDGNCFYGKAVVRTLCIGVSVCNPEDTFDEKMGKEIAYKKAKYGTNSLRLCSVSKGVINKTLVDAFMKQEMNFIKANPDKVIKGYTDTKTRYENRKSFENEYNSLTEQERNIVELAANNQLEKYVSIAQKLKNYEQKH